MKTPHKKVKRDGFQLLPPNQPAIVNARARSLATRSRAQAVVGGNRRPRAPQEKFKMLDQMPLDILYEVCIVFPLRSS